MNYPETTRGQIVDEHFGVSIPDPYRWLEKDIRREPEVALWVDAQNSLSAPYLANLPGRAVFRERLTALYDHERLSTPEKRGERYFFVRNSGLDPQSILTVREGTNGADRVVIDPNEWSEDGTTALAEWSPSEDGTHLAFAIQEDGADWRTIRVLDVASGTILEDEIRWARFTNIAWVKDGSGFFYSRNPQPAEDASFETPVTDHAVYFHTLGTPQSEDRVVHAPQTGIPAIQTVETTPDGRYAVIYSSALQGGNALSVVDLGSPEWTVRSVVGTFESLWTLAGNIGSKLYLVTQDGAQRGRLVTVDLADPEPASVEVIAEREDAVLRVATLVGDRLVAAYTIDARTEVERFRLDGTPDGAVELPGIGSAGAFHGRPGDDEAFFVFTSHDAPTSIYRYDVATNTRSIWAEPDAKVELANIRVDQHFYASKDGTRVPIFVVRRADLTGPAPTMLTAYGGFGIPMVPFYSPDAMAWVEQGGVYAVANIRGGGEYGKAWHEGGRGRHKQNSYDDFIAAAEFLKGEGITAPDGLAIHGESNGGLLVGAVVNQRPDLFAAALPGVGVMDMLRFEHFTGGPLWAQEFGSPTVEADFRNIMAYSPLHNISGNEPYPAILATTADTDDRVVPSHSFKYVATLQAADIGERPHILRVETSAGHGTGKSIERMIDEMADKWAFAAHWTGLTVKLRD
ncbi:prolyl oligopeptidase [Aurantimonas endophytica]|uniref:prolyl oligopeptidase n=2 Tax=Aurantimonas endophytica TaxID=1522175 RepID=A0A7W6HD49_9HYPH|nr:prolyl oligopeptidase family serine peptidase [Aurantimonas endophytica]MBB4003029.1 prolyl oligopeptidase [Aurantimonas endophytica]MCO6403902.1 prolyl oligopeptidase family serine peptidase [Aurantimonas endophytica]